MMTPDERMSARNRPIFAALEPFADERLAFEASAKVARSEVWRSFCEWRKDRPGARPEDVWISNRHFAAWLRNRGAKDTSMRNNLGKIVDGWRGVTIK
jgi:hypothetical protein